MTSTSGQLRVGCASHVGHVRTHNEDSLFILTTSQLGDLASDDPFGLFILADGMGGHKAGEVASHLTVHVVAQRLATDVLVPYLHNNEHIAAHKPITDAMRDAVEAADAAVKDQVAGGGTTLTCALVMGRHVYIAHVGDSRAYIFAENALRQITRDHTLVDRLVEMGQISPAEALSHPQRNVLYRAVGQGDGPDVDTYIEPMPLNSQVLLCSDGLWGMITDDQIASILSARLAGKRGSLCSQEICEALIEAANQAGGKDNITVVLIAKE